MSLRTGENGELLLLSDGRLLEVDENGDGCCCGGDNGPMCCYNDRCQVVSCDSPDAVGGVVACEPCRTSNLNFCGYCPRTYPTTLPDGVNRLIENGEATSAVNTTPPDRFPERFPICKYVQLDSLEISFDVKGVLNSDPQDIRRFPGGGLDYVVVFNSTFDAAFEFTASSGRAPSSGTTGWSISFRLFPRNGDPNITFAERMTVFVTDVVGWTYEANGKIKITSINYGPLDRTTCKQLVTYNYEMEYSASLRDENGVLQDEDPPVVSSNSTSGSITKEIDFSEDNCGEGEIFNRYQRIFDDVVEEPSNHMTIKLTTKPFTQQNPTCNT